jgi:sporulation protein YlmC with PRC-barrel domain
MISRYGKYGAALSMLLTCASPTAFAATHYAATQNGAAASESAPTKSGAVPETRATTKNGAATPTGDTTKTGSDTKNGNTTKGRPIAQTTIRTDQLRAGKIIGAEVYDRNNVKIGTVGDIVLDRDGRVAAVVLDTGGFLGIGSRNVAVRFSDLKIDKNRLILDISKNQFEGLATYHLERRATQAAGAPLPAPGGKSGSDSNR